MIEQTEWVEEYLDREVWSGKGRVKDQNDTWSFSPEELLNLAQFISDQTAYKFL